MSPHHHLSVSVYIIICLCYSPGMATALSFSFNFSSSGSGDLCDTELRCERDTRMGSGVIELTKNEINGNVLSVGRASYARPVMLWDDATGEVASFSSSFTFQIKPKNSSDDHFGLCNFTTAADDNADGMSFFLAPYPSRIPPNSWGPNFALFNTSNCFNATGDERIVAVEFDTYLNDWDHSDNHVGIDVNSIYSKSYMNVTKRMVSDDATMTAEISYDNRTGILVARVQMDGDERIYNVNTSVDMKRELPLQVAVGFSAATGFCAELHQVLSWSFSSTIDDDATATASTVPRLRRRSLVPVLVPSAAAFLVLLCGGAVIVRQRRKREQAEFEKGVGPRRYRYHELAAATKGFAKEGKLGRGGFGSVYQGSGLSDQDSLVAIKMLSPESFTQGRREFESEVKIISRVRHRNLVHLLGWSDSKRGLLLVYEHLSEGSSTSTYTTPIVRSLGQKAGGFRAGEARGSWSRAANDQIVKGTEWYVDPEFIRSRRPSTEADVHSFGIVMLEVVSGQPPGMVDEVSPLLMWIWDMYEKGTILDAVDNMLQLGDGCKRQMRRALVVGLWCTHPRIATRPSIVELMNVLQSEDVMLPTLSWSMSGGSLGSHGHNASTSAN
ncbi:hypothetical protein ZWY2020_031192 [Hordeum vulgare]|nr:hypothetical protein ZWY2020_031192 [Hordeum vulgare]